VCYHLAESFASGKILGPGVEIDLVLHEYARTKSLMDLYTAEHEETTLDGVVMEMTDLACPLLTTVTPTTNARVAFADCCTIVLLDEVSGGVVARWRARWLMRLCASWRVWFRAIQ